MQQYLELVLVGAKDGLEINVDKHITDEVKMRSKGSPNKKVINLEIGDAVTLFDDEDRDKSKFEVYEIKKKYRFKNGGGIKHIYVDDWNEDLRVSLQDRFYNPKVCQFEKY